VKITEVRNYLATDGGGPAVITAIETDAGITGYGEGTLQFYPQAVYGMLNDLRPHLIGEDPRRIEYLWQMCWRRLFARGGPINGSAVAAIDQALWDIKGKALEVPVYELLGGLARERVRVYGHATGMTEEDIAEKARERASRGVTAIRFRGFHDTDDRDFHEHSAAVDQQISFLRAIREAVGDDVDLIVECHGRYDLEWAVRLAERAEPYNPYYIEDPIRHENPQVIAQLRQKTRIPLACGERHHSKWEFREVVVGNLVDYIRPDVCWCGGISEVTKIGALAETYYVNLILHNNAGALGTAAGLHAALAIPNLTLLEAPWVNRKPGTGGKRAIGPFPSFAEGFALPLEGPGLGVTVDEEALSRSVFKPRHQPKLMAADGSIRDW
jgi:galactonate dehydratase